MAASVKVGFFDTRTSLGLLSATGVGFTPKLVLFFGANHGIGGTDQDDHHKFMGAMTATAQHAWGIEPLHAMATSNTVVAHSNAHCLYVPDAGGTRILDAVYTSMDADGFTIQQTDFWTSPIRVYYMAFGGEELEVAIGAAAARTTLGTQDITGPGWEPDFIMCHGGIGTASMPHTAGNFASSGFVGFATSPAAQFVSGWRANTGDTSQNCSTYQKPGVLISSPNVAGSGSFREAALNLILPDGFRLNWTAVNATAAWYFWIALKGIDATVGSFITTPGAGDNQSVSVGRKPQLVFLQSGNKPAAATSQAHFRHSWGVSDGTNKWSIWGGERDHGTTVAATISATRADVTRVFRIGAENATGPSCDNHCAIDTLTPTANGFDVHYDITTVTGQEVQFFALGTIAVAAAASVSRRSSGAGRRHSRRNPR